MEMERLPHGQSESLNHPSAMRHNIHRASFSFKGEGDFLFFYFFSSSFQGSAGWLLDPGETEAYSELLGMCEMKQLRFLEKKNQKKNPFFLFFSFLVSNNKKKRKWSQAAFSLPFFFLPFLRQQDYSSVSPVTQRSGWSGELFWHKYDCKDTSQKKIEWEIYILFVRAIWFQCLCPAGFELFPPSPSFSSICSQTERYVLQDFDAADSLRPGFSLRPPLEGAPL